MAPSEDPQNGSRSNGTPPETQPSWTYPTRTCRVCLEEVPATVALYPPGLPPAFQRPIVEYKNEDEYGRLVKPCHCRGGMRYIHELCLRRLRTESVRPGSLWKCHQCGYKFNFNRLTVQKYLDSKISSGVLTILVMLLVMFMLGFVADPILNLYADPYETIVGHEDVWQPVRVNDPRGGVSGWAQHFTKGMVSMGLLSFVRTMILNPFQWWNLRNTGFVSSRISGRSTTGRDRAINVSWIAVAMGILSASYFFYKWVQTIIGKSLSRIGNNIVDTQLPGDDEDLKPPPGWKFEDIYPEAANAAAGVPRDEGAQTVDNETKEKDHESDTVGRGTMPGTWGSTAYSSALDDVQSQDWSFRGL
ncbi:RING finger domain protein [Cladophialophora carrionii]|uniref:RING finger domain protein n=1 Tax=Cladophialophora carrionii TaxID=86049 RepID=A0A1C1CHY9_9EURO|nr:RING finger domain protein [Cladophialophora carrionii]